MTGIRVFLALTLLLLLTACPMTPSTGALNVQISGLPTGLNAAVTVTGPGGFSQTLTQSTPLNNLQPGDYTVTATAVRSGLEVYLGSPATQTKSVSAGSSTTATVTYTLNPTRITGYTLDPTSPGTRIFGQNVTVSFSYVTDQAGGVRIFVRPFTGGSLTPDYAACGSPLYNAPSGSGNCTFTISSGSGPVTVDQLRFQIYNADQSALLYEVFVSVNFVFNPNPSRITSLTTSPASPATLTIDSINQDLTSSFEYVTDQSAGIRIFPRPITGGNLTPNYAASGSPLYPAPSGSGTSSFTITSGATAVDHIRVQIYDSSNTTLLGEQFFPVNVQFVENPNRVRTQSASPTSPATLTFGNDVTVSFAYASNQNVRIFVRPITGGSLTPNYGACGSPLYSAPSGNGTCTFNIISGSAPVVVDHLRFQVYDASQSSLLFEAFVPVHYTFQ